MLTISNRLFTNQELSDLATPYPDRIKHLINKRDIDAAILLTKEMAESRIRLHDFFADSCTILWSFVGEQMGENTIDAMFRYIFAKSAKRQFFDAASAQVMPHLSVYLLSKSWRAHCCFEKGNHPGKFSISEDDEKFTFHMHPCGSGSRLKMKGWYEPDAGGKLSEKAHSWTYNQNRFPYYCIHCPFLNEILPYESSYGALLWPVDPPDSESGPCAWHIYKDPNNIPIKYYNRLGLAKKTIATGPYRKKPNRFFTKAQLKEMAQPLTDRILEKLSSKDFKSALKLCRNVKDEFLVLHDLYVNMLASTLSFISETGSKAMLGKALSRQYDLCANQQLIQPMSSMSLMEKTSFLANHIFGTDTCNETGYHPGKFKITETDSDIIFTLNPCGSGGRLIKASSDKPMGKIKKWREKIETAVITFFSHRLPLPEPIVRFVFPFMVTHFTQRKPHDLITTKTAKPWAFNQAGISVFCAQCGTIQDKLGTDFLKITPPTNRKDPCIWKLSKQDC